MAKQLKVQAYLQNKTLADLKEEFGIKSKISPDNDFVILNYDQVKSHKLKEHPIVMECRQLVLENNTWDLISKSFTRFLNWNESKTLDDIFFTAPSTAITYCTKHDGSLMMMFFYKNKWHLITRNGFSDHVVGKGTYTWISLFEETIGSDIQKLGSVLDQNHSYIFEVCSKHNMVVRPYENPVVYLLASVNKNDLSELSDAELDLVSNQMNFVIDPSKLILRPEIHKVEESSNLYAYLEDLSNKERTFEGLIGKLETSAGVFLRCKFKTQSYLYLHHFGRNKEMTAENIVPIILSGEYDEINSHPNFAKHPEMAAIKKQMEEEYLILDNLWQKVSAIENQKEFSSAIQQSPLKSILFAAKKNKYNLVEQWKLSAMTIIKYINSKKTYK